MWELLEAQRRSGKMEIIEHSIHPHRLGIDSHYPEHSRVRVCRDFPDDGVACGEEGTIVYVYEDGGYEVEFLAGRDRPAVVTVENEDVEPPLTK